MALPKSESETTKRKRGRPVGTALVYSVAEVAQLLDLRENLVLARLRMGGFFPGAYEAEGVWHVPATALRHCLQCRVRPLFSIRTAAALLGLSYDHVFKQTALVQALSDPLPPGKSIRALPLFFGAGDPMKRIHEDELLRVQGLLTRGGVAHG